MSAMIKMFAAQIDRIAPTPRERALLSALCAVGAIALAVEAGAYALQSRSALLDAVSATMASQWELAALRDPRHRAELASVAGMARDRSFDDPTLAIAAVRAQSAWTPFGCRFSPPTKASRVLRCCGSRWKAALNGPLSTHC
ncbi:MAG: hypothetical protein EBZ50_00530 [Alphaproteobacteria bacterium]|nr:hypothetical protein [Alphaproteobacteria bacterium]